MSGIKILGTGHALPQNSIPNQWFADRLDTSDDWISSRTGIQNRRHITGGESHTGLCTQAAKLALKNAGLSPEQIGICIVATVTPDLVTPAASCMVAKQLGLEEDTLCFDLNAACTGFLYGLHTAQCLLAASRKQYALVIGGEVLSRILDMEDRGTCILFGDGAGAVIAQWGENFPSLHAQMGHRGDDQMLTIAGPGTGAPPKIKMEGTAVFKFAVETVPKCIHQVLTASGCEIDEIDFFVFHQANARIIDLVVRKFGIPAEKYWKNIGHYGNTSAASIPILLSELCQQGKISQGSRVLCVGFGGGLTWGGGLIQF